MPPPPRIFNRRRSSEIESAEQQRNPQRSSHAPSSPLPGSLSLPPQASSPLPESSSLPPQAATARLSARPSQPNRSSNSGALTPEQMRVLQIVQRENPGDQEKMERFLKESLDYKLAVLYKAHLKSERANARQMQSSRATRQEADLRATVRPIIRRRLILGRYDEASWSNAGKVFADVKLELNDDFDGLEGAVSAVGKVRVEEKAKLKDRLKRAQDLLTQPLRAFADCVRCEVGNLNMQYVEDCSALWEAAARWRWVLLKLNQTDQARDSKFWPEISSIFAEMDPTWDFFPQDLDEYGFEEASNQILDPGLD